MGPFSALNPLRGGAAKSADADFGCLIFDSWERIGDRANNASRDSGGDREGCQEDMFNRADE
jgi:hypothetical protein